MTDAVIAPTVGVSSTNPRDMPTDHAALPMQTVKYRDARYFADQIEKP